MLLAGALQDALDVQPRHALAHFIVHDGPARPVEDRAQIVECSLPIRLTHNAD
jgi:hypothetical protein